MRMPDNQVDAVDAMRRRVMTALSDAADQRALLRALESLAGDKSFAAAADLWAPALYARNAYFFEPFLLRHLSADAHQAIITDLLRRAEADGYDTLFTGLYRKVTDADSWNADLVALAASPQADDALSRAVRRRDLADQHLLLSEDAAVALYRRNSAVLGAFVLDHVRPGRDWQAGGERAYAGLRLAAKQQGDDAMTWALFRRFATPDEWSVEMRTLLATPDPPASLIDALKKRQPDHLLDMDPAILIDFIGRFGAAMIPYLELNMDWVGRIDRDKLIQAVETMGDESFFRRVFFRYGAPKAWREHIAALVRSDLSGDALAEALARWQLPAAMRDRRGWWLGGDLALALYQRDPARYASWVARTAHEPPLALFQAVAARNDTETLDDLVFAFFAQLSTIAATAYVMNDALKLSDLADKQHAAVAPVGKFVVAYLDHLASVSPAEYVAHAARIISPGIGAAWKMRGDDPAANPVAYLAQRHRDAWARSDIGMRELLESPDSAVVELGLEFLDVAGAGAASRVVENLPTLQALLLGANLHGLKRKVLLCLERAASAGVEFASAIAPMLGEAMWYRGEHAIDERVMVSFVRARRWATPGAARVGG